LKGILLVQKGVSPYNQKETFLNLKGILLVQKGVSAYNQKGTFLNLKGILLVQKGVSPYLYRLVNKGNQLARLSHNLNNNRYWYECRSCFK
jgi:hypothetical protein